MYVWERLHARRISGRARRRRKFTDSYSYPFFFIGSILLIFDDLVESTLLAGGKSKKERKDGYLGDPARGQADPGSATVCTMDWPGPVIRMYVCVGTVSHAFEPPNPLVVAIAKPQRVRGKGR
jgi:hypothetical protein